MALTSEPKMPFLNHVRSHCDLDLMTSKSNQFTCITFAAAGPHLWNSLPVQLCNPDIT